MTRHVVPNLFSFVLRDSQRACHVSHRGKVSFQGGCLGGCRRVGSLFIQLQLILVRVLVASSSFSESLH